MNRIERVFTAAPIILAKLTFLAVLTSLSAGVSSLAIAQPPAQPPAQQRSLADFLEPGQQITLSGGNSSGGSGAYVVQVYHPLLKAATLETTEILASQRDATSAARSQAIMDAMRRGEIGAAAARDFIGARSRSGFGGSRVAAPERMTFYEVVEIGKDFVGVKQGKSIRYISLPSIREISMLSVSDEEAKEQADAQIASAHVMVFSRMLAAYAADMGQLPTPSQGLQALVRAPMDLEDSSGWRGPYFPKPAIPDDPWGKPYAWTAKDDGAQVEVRTGGADGKLSTADDLVATAPVLFVSSDGGAGGFGGDGGFGAARGGFGAPAGAVPTRPEFPRAPRPVDSPPSLPAEGRPAEERR